MVANYTNDDSDNQDKEEEYDPNNNTNDNGEGTYIGHTLKLHGGNSIVTHLLKEKNYLG